jgi:hypothetical protein
MRTAAKFGLVALIALGFTALPGGGAALDVLLTLLMVAFFVAIALFGYRLYREHRFTIDTLPDGHRLVLFASIGLAVLTFAATARLFAIEGFGWLIWLALLAVASYGVFWVLVRSRRAL